MRKPCENRTGGPRTAARAARERRVLDAATIRCSPGGVARDMHRRARESSCTRAAATSATERLERGCYSTRTYAKIHPGSFSSWRGAPTSTVFPRIAIRFPNDPRE